MTLTKMDIINHLVEDLGISRQQGRMVVNTFFSEIKTHLIAGSEVKLSGFGNFVLNDKKSRPGRNPKTGDEVEIAARRVVTFKAGQKLREQVESVQSREIAEVL